MGREEYFACAEDLSAIINRNENVGLVYGCAIARGAPSISHILFADLFFGLRKLKHVP